MSLFSIITIILYFFLFFYGTPLIFKIIFWGLRKAFLIILLVQYFYINPLLNLIICYLLFKLTKNHLYFEQFILLKTILKNNFLLILKYLTLFLSNSFVFFLTFLKKKLYIFIFVNWFQKKNIFFLQYLKNLKKKNNLAWFFENKK